MMRMNGDRTHRPWAQPTRTFPCSRGVAAPVRRAPSFVGEAAGAIGGSPLISGRLRKLMWTSAATIGISFPASAKVPRQRYRREMLAAIGSPAGREAVMAPQTELEGGPHGRPPI